MRHIFISILIIVLLLIILFAWSIFYLPNYSHRGEHPGVKSPLRPSFGPGGSNYHFQKVISYSFGQNQNKSWIFVPQQADLNKLPIVLLIHGWSATYLRAPEYRPDEAFINHLVKKGNIVIYPVYLRGFLTPLPTKYVNNVALLTKESLLQIRKLAPNNDLSKFAIIGYSIGGTIATYLPTIKGLPLPKAIILVEPTEGVPFHIPVFNIPFFNLNKLPKSAILTVLFGSDDRIVPLKETIREIAHLSSELPSRYFFEIQSDFYGDPPLAANHFGFLGSYTERIFPINTIDYEYQKIIDASLDCAFFKRYCNMIKGDDPEFLKVGFWSNGTKVKPIKKIDLTKIK